MIRIRKFYYNIRSRVMHEVNVKQSYCCKIFLLVISEEQLCFF